MQDFQEWYDGVMSSWKRLSKELGEQEKLCQQEAESEAVKILRTARLKTLEQQQQEALIKADIAMFLKHIKDENKLGEIKAQLPEYGISLDFKW